MRRKNIIGQVCDTPKSYDNVMHVGLRKVTFKWQRGNKIGKDTKEHDTFAPVEIAVAILLQGRTHVAALFSHVWQVRRAFHGGRRGLFSLRL